MPSNSPKHGRSKSYKRGIKMTTPFHHCAYYKYSKTNRQMIVFAIGQNFIDVHKTFLSEEGKWPLISHSRMLRRVQNLFSKPRICNSFYSFA